MDADGTNVKRLTHDAGLRRRRLLLAPTASRSSTGRAARSTEAELEEYKALLDDGLVRPTTLEI